MVLVKLFHFRELSKAGERQKNDNITAAMFYCLSAFRRFLRRSEGTRFHIISCAAYGMVCRRAISCPHACRVGYAWKGVQGRSVTSRLRCYIVIRSQSRRIPAYEPWHGRG